ncbi:MAG: diguanylate cyclase (GGDEF)-like protein [Candidatus Azotimanducaceae bacterium]
MLPSSSDGLFMSAIALPHGFSIHYDITDGYMLHTVESMPFAVSAVGMDTTQYLVTDQLSKFKGVNFEAGILLDTSCAPLDLPDNVISLVVEHGEAFTARLVGLITALSEGHQQTMLSLQRSSSRKLNDVVIGIEETIVWTDQEFAIITATRGAVELFNEQVHRLIGRNFLTLVNSDEDDTETMLAKRATINTPEKIEIQGKRNGGQKYWLKVGIRAVSGKRYQLNLIDITSQKAADRRFIQLSNYDPMTGLANRGLLFEFLQHAMARSKRSNSSVALILLDLDHFDQVSDETGVQLGVQLGDGLITSAAERIKQLLNDQDMLARWGGDELAIVLEDIESPEIASRLAQRIIAIMSNPFVMDDKDHYISPSIGIAIYPAADETINGLIQAADTAMFEAKKFEGRNTYRFYAVKLQEEEEERAQIEKMLRRALDNGEFSLVYQPKVSVKAEKVIGFEALLRWQHPDWDNISPGVYIPIAEECGLISQIGDWVLRQACTQMATWQAKYPQMADCTIAVNVSAKQLTDTFFASRVASILADAKLSSTKLEIELTESSVMEDPEQGIRILERLHELGVKISIDDFGTGYSSLSYLRKLPIDCVKIDRSFVLGIGNDLSSESIIHAILVMSSKMGLTNVAEGIETPEQLRFFDATSCDVIQGYIFSKPLTETQIDDMFGGTQRALQDRFEEILIPNPLTIDCASKHPN